MSWTDNELDELFKEAASGQTFEYKNAYFKDIEVQLPVRKKKTGFIWFFGGSALVLLIGAFMIFSPSQKSDKGLVTMSSTENNNVSAEKSILKEELSNKIDQNKTTIQDNSFSTVSTKDEFNVAVKEPLTVEEVQKEDLATNTATSEVLVPNVDSSIGTADEASLDLISDVLVGSEVNGLETNKIQPLDQTSAELLSSIHPKFKKQRSSSFFIELSGGYGQSPIVSTEYGSSRSKNLSGQIGYSHSFGKWGLSAGVGLSEHYFNNIYIKERSTIYGFGVNTLDQQYELSSVSRLDIPLSFNYNLGNHSLSAGINAAIPLYSRYSFVKWVDGQESEVGTGITGREFFKPIIIEPSFGYNYSFAKNWSIGAKLSAQLNNPLNSDRIKGNRTTLPLSGQITLRKSFQLK